MSRKQDLRLYNQLYKFKSPLTEERACQYCGVSTDLTIEHIPPISTAQLFVRGRRIKFWTILACQECNSLIGDQLLPTFVDRFFRVKEILLKRYEKKLLREFRSLSCKTEEDLINADIQFFRTLDRVGFGLYSFDQLNKKSKKILSEKIDSYDETLGALIASRSKLGLHYENNLDEDSIKPEYLKELYETFLKSIHERDVRNQMEYEAKFESEILENKLPSQPENLFAMSWAELLEGALVYDELSYTTFEEFKSHLIEYEIYSEPDYKYWFQRNETGLAAGLMLPERPEMVYRTPWVFIVSDIQNEIESPVKKSRLKDYEVLDVIELNLSPELIDASYIKKGIVDSLNKLGIHSENEYTQLLKLICGTGYEHLFPKEFSEINIFRKPK